MTGPEIKTLRLSLGWTQQQLADYLCVCGRDRVWQMESAEYTAQGPTLMLLNYLHDHREGVIVDVVKFMKPPREVTPLNLIAFRKAKRMTQGAFGKLMGVSWQYVSYLENGKRRICNRLSRLIRLVK